jgi:phosphatidylinositol 4-kinase A
MKPILDEVTDKIVQELSGDARNFYDREFSFFHEVTSISGKLKPFIKKSKPEKKVLNITSYFVCSLIFMIVIDENR